MTTLGNEYDLAGGCPRCGTGSRRVSPLYVKASDLSGSAARGVVETGSGEFLIDEIVARAFRSEGISAELREVRRHTDRRPLPWFHLSSRVTLPPRSGRTVGGERENPCVVCGRDGYFDSDDPLQLVYDKDALARDPGLPDVALTWEAYGNSWLEPPSERYLEGARIAQPLVLVSTRVVTLLRGLQLRHLEFEPVRIV